MVYVPFTDQLGYSPEGGSGWCTLKVHNEDGEQNVFAVIFGNDLWIYLTFITVTILYVSVHCHIKFHVSSYTYSYCTSTNVHAVTNIESQLNIREYICTFHCSSRK